MRYRFFIIIIVLLGVFHVSSPIVIAQEKNIGEPCNDTSDCIKGLFCFRDTCERDPYAKEREEDIISIQNKNQNKKDIGDPCTDTIECKDGAFYNVLCDSRTHTCVRDFGSDSGISDKQTAREPDIRKSVRDFAFKGLTIITSFLVLISVGLVFLWRKVFGKENKAGMIKKIIIAVLLFSVALGWIGVILGWIIIVRVLNIASQL